MSRFHISNFFNLIYVNNFTLRFSNFIFFQLCFYCYEVKLNFREKITNFLFFFPVGWHHYNFPENLYNVTPPASLYSATQQPDSTSSLHHQQPSGEIVYYNNSTDSSDYVTTTSNHSLTPTNGSLTSNTLNTGSVSFQQRRGSLQLWQFLIALLDEPSSK